jgi:hypothetical protein
MTSQPAVTPSLHRSFIGTPKTISLKTVLSGVRGRALHIGCSQEGNIDMGINIIMVITVAVRGDLATPPIAPPSARKVTMPKIDILIKAAQEPRTLTSKPILPMAKRTIIPRAIKIIWLRAKPRASVEVLRGVTRNLWNTPLSICG